LVAIVVSDEDGCGGSSPGNDRRAQAVEKVGAPISRSRYFPPIFMASFSF
jgi:hypothetical protein